MGHRPREGCAAMSQPETVRLVRAKQDTIMDAAGAAVFALALYFVINPDKYNRLTEAISARIDAMLHRLSIWQTKLSIDSLPETDE